MLFLLHFRQELYIFLDDDKHLSQLIATPLFTVQNKALKYFKNPRT